jgi:hypothetical protein
MNATQIENIKKAIELAKQNGHQGECRYVTDGKPDCVVAQLATIEGVSIEDLAKWEKKNVLAAAMFNKPGANSLREKGYNTEFLLLLQRIWDGEYVPTDDEDKFVNCYSAKSAALLMLKKTNELTPDA